MAYTKGMLDRYAESIENEDQRRQFEKGVTQIEFSQDGGRQMCSSDAVETAFSGTAVEHLARDFRNRYGEFMSPEDLGR